MTEYEFEHCCEGCDVLASANAVGIHVLERGTTGVLERGCSLSADQRTMLAAQLETARGPLLG